MGILDITELEVEYEATRFVETDGVPPDSQQVGDVWEKSNKDGSRDKRYAENRQSSDQHGEITFKSGSGISMRNICSAILKKRRNLPMPCKRLRVFLEALTPRIQTQGDNPDRNGNHCNSAYSGQCRHQFSKCCHG